MEDLYVLDEWRGRGVGRALWRRLAQVIAVCSVYKVKEIGNKIFLFRFDIIHIVATYVMKC